MNKRTLVRTQILALASALLAGCGGSTPSAVQRNAAERATHYRQGLCASMAASLQRLHAVQAAAQDQRDIESIRFILGNMLGAFPAHSVAPDSRLLAAALRDPARIATLRDAAAAAAAALGQAPDPAAFARRRTQLRERCMDCHAAIAPSVPPLPTFVGVAGAASGS